MYILMFFCINNIYYIQVRVIEKIYEFTLKLSEFTLNLLENKTILGVGWVWVYQ